MRRLIQYMTRQSNIETECGTGPYIPHSLLLQWHITERCNLRCLHCYQEEYSGAELQWGQWMNVIEQFKSLLTRWRLQTGQPKFRGHITVTGGEPFVHADFMKLLQHFSEDRAWYSFAILSNGSLIDDTVARKLEPLRPAFVQVSMEGKQETHDRLRGDGNFEKTQNAIRHLVSRNIPTLVSFTAHRENYKEFGDVVAIAQKLGVKKVWSDRFLPNGAGMDHMAGEALTPEETQEYFQSMADIRNKTKRRWFGKRTEVAMDRALQFLEGDGRPYFCKAGDSLITLMPNGDVYPCRRMPVHVGNLTEQTLETIYYENHLLKKLRDPEQVSEGCEGCFYSGMCKGGLKCMSFAVHGDPFVRDPGCYNDLEEEGDIIKVFEGPPGTKLCHPEPVEGGPP